MRAFVAVIATLFAVQPVLAQTPGGGWGQWSRLTTATTGIETRVRCEYSVEKDSMWAYQFKNVSGHTVDIVAKEQEASNHSTANDFSAPGMFTLKNGAISFPYEGVMHGTCAQVHNLKIEFVCVVPQGEDHPCFANPDGTRVAAKLEKTPGNRNSTQHVPLRTLVHFDPISDTERQTPGFVNRHLTVGSIVGKWFCSPNEINEARTGIQLRNDIKIPLDIEADGRVSFGPSTSSYRLQDAYYFDDHYAVAEWGQEKSSLEAIEGGSRQENYRNTPQVVARVFFYQTATDNSILTLQLFGQTETSEGPMFGYECRWQ